MKTTVTGMFITTRGWQEGPSSSRPETRTRPNGTFVLRMPVINRLSDGRTERYIVLWSGPEAQAWWEANSRIGSGKPLQMVLEDPVVGEAPAGKAIHAQVRSCSLLQRPAPPTRRERLGLEVKA